jgi:carbamoylphosphate synthase small subunit
MNEAEIEEENKKDRYWGNKTRRYGTSPSGKNGSAKTKSKVKYAFGYRIHDAFDLFDEDDIFETSNMATGYFTREEKIHMKTLELNVSFRDVKALKKQYKKLVKQYHPDVNPENDEAEMMFKKVAAAYSELLDLWS